MIEPAQRRRFYAEEIEAVARRKAMASGPLRAAAVTRLRRDTHEAGRVVLAAWPGVLPVDVTPTSNLWGHPQILYRSPGDQEAIVGFK